MVSLWGAKTFAKKNLFEKSIFFFILGQSFFILVGQIENAYSTKSGRFLVNMSSNCFKKMENGGIFGSSISWVVPLTTSHHQDFTLSGSGIPAWTFMNATTTGKGAAHKIHPSM